MDTRKQLEDWRAECTSNWTDTRIVDAEWVDANIWFWMHSYADFAQLGLELTGATFREKHGDWLLVLKLAQGDIRQVAFVTSSTPTRCMSKARKLLRNGGLLVYPDKFA